MIYICYGPTKSASTFLYQLAEEILAVGGRHPRTIGPPLKPSNSVENYFDDITPALLSEISRAAGIHDVVLKTHQRAHPEIARLVEDGSIPACASIRDPREIALSMLDHGRLSRRVKFTEFSELHDLKDTFSSLDNQIEAFKSWASIPRIRIFTFNEICFDTEHVVRSLAAHYGVVADPIEVLKPFKGRFTIGNFNRGSPLRYREMPEGDQATFLERYASLYAQYSFDTPAAVKAANLRSGPVRPEGEVSLRLTHIRRLLRKLIAGR